MDQLPEYMQTFFGALLDLYNEIEKEIVNEGWSYRVQYAKEAVCHCQLSLRSSIFWQSTFFFFFFNPS